MNSDLSTAYTEHYPSLLRYARSRGFSQEEAEDVVGDTFVTALRSTYREQGDMRGFLFCILRSRMIDQRRRWTRHPSVPLVEWVDMPDEGVEDAIITTLSVWERITPLLTAQQRLLVWECYINDRSTEDIARCLNLSYLAAKARLQRGRARLFQNRTWSYAQP